MKLKETLKLFEGLGTVPNFSPQALKTCKKAGAAGHGGSTPLGVTAVEGHMLIDRYLICYVH